MRFDFTPVLADEKIFAENYRLPSPELFAKPKRVDDISDKDIMITCDKIKSCFDSFNVKATIVGVDIGPRVARYIIEPDKGTNVKEILDLVPDLHLYTYAKGIREVAPFAGTKNVALEIDRERWRLVSYREAIESPEFSENKSPTAICLGIDVTGKAVVADLDRMNGLIVGGRTGSGKSVLIDNIIANILCKADPHEFKLALIDPKQVEFTRYKRLPHLYAPIANNKEDTINILEGLLAEAKRRVEILESVGKSFKEYNASTGEKLPHIAIIADEIADFIITSAKNKFIKTLVDLVSMGSKCGIYVIIATQRPDINVLTKELRDAFGSRACLRVAIYQDSRLVLDCVGAERLLSCGDMLFRGIPNVQELKRIQVPFISDKEMSALIEYVKSEDAKCNAFSSPEVADAPNGSDTTGAQDDNTARMMLEIESEDNGDDYATAMAEKFNRVDASILPQLVEAMDLATEQRLVSTALIQRRMSIGFGKAARIIDYMEDMGFVSEKEGAKPRKVFLNKDEWKSISEIVKKKYHLDAPKEIDGSGHELFDLAKLFDLEEEPLDDTDDNITDTTALSEKSEAFDMYSDRDFLMAVDIALATEQISIALIQRRLGIGFSKAARIIDYMEKTGLVSEKNGAKPRNVLINRAEWEEIYSRIEIKQPKNDETHIPTAVEEVKEIDFTAFKEEALKRIDELAQVAERMVNHMENDEYDTTVESISTKIRIEVMGTDIDISRLAEAIHITVIGGEISTATLQRKMNIGFSKAIRFIDFMEAVGIISERDGAKPRNVLITEKVWRDILEELKDPSL